MSQDMEQFPYSPVQAATPQEIFYVAADGETTGEIEHLKQVYLEIEQLSDAKTSVALDMRKISGSGWSGLDGIQIMLLDFGVPPRNVTVRADFQTSAETQASGYDSENDSSPNTLTITAPSSLDSSHTLNLDDNSYDSGVRLRRESFLYLAHDGEPVSTRTGFLDTMAELAIAEYGAWGRYENLLKLSYEGHNLTIEIQNHSRALVAYGKSVGFTERHATVEEIPKEITALVMGIEDEASRQAVLDLHSRLTSLAVEHAATLDEIETVEALLQHNKGLLRTEKSKVWRLQTEVNRLKSQGDGASQASSGWTGEHQDGRAASGSEIERQCAVIGLDPSIVKTAQPELITAAAKSMRKVWAKSLHPDVSEQDGEALKTVNAAVDAILSFFNT